MRSSGIRQFPWSRLETATRAEVHALRDAKRWAASHLQPEGVRRALGAIVGAEVDLRIGRAAPMGVPPGDDWAGVLIAGADEASPAALIELEPALAAHILARVLDRPSHIIGSSSPGRGIAGAVAAVLIAAVRRSHAAVAMRVLNAGPAAALEAELIRDDPEPWAIFLAVTVGHDAFAARVVVSTRAAFSATGAPWDALALSALGHTPLTVPVVACATMMTAGELAALQPGDALIPLPGHGAWLPAASEAAAESPAWLAAPSSEVGLRAQLAAGGRLVLRGELESFVTGELPMDRDANAATVSVLGDVPIVVRVEIGEATMSAREWASLGRGDVVALGRRPGDLVLLRAGGAPVARGELIQLDGELAVRIAERIGGGGASP